MIAAISPADVQYEETLSTLRYADQAKKIKNKAVVNEDPNAKLVRELKEELEMLRARVSGSHVSESIFDPSIPATQQKVTYQAKDGTIKTVTKAELQDQLETSEKLMQSLNETWEEKMQRTQQVQKERERALEELGITVEKNDVGVHTPKKVGYDYHVINFLSISSTYFNEDASSSQSGTSSMSQSQFPLNHNCGILERRSVKISPDLTWCSPHLCRPSYERVPNLSVENRSHDGWSFGQREAGCNSTQRREHCRRTLLFRKH